MQAIKRTIRRQLLTGIHCATAFAALSAGVAVAQPHKTAAVAVTAPSTPENSGETQEKLLALLRMSPTLANVVANDPSLLSNQDYVSHLNPELAEFLAERPQIARNPAFYLFSDLRQPGRKPYPLLQPKSGFEHHGHEQTETEMIVSQIGPVIALICFAGGVMWLVRMVTESRRWMRLLKQQSEVHGKLIDRFGTNQELLAYMQTEAGRRFLEAAPPAAGTDRQRVPNVVARVLTTLQAGIVMTLLGAGLLFVRHSVEDGQTALLVLGVIILMPGIGFAISAGITWVLAGRLGLMPSGRDAVSTERL